MAEPLFLVTGADKHAIVEQFLKSDSHLIARQAVAALPESGDLDRGLSATARIGSGFTGPHERVQLCASAPGLCQLHSPAITSSACFGPHVPWRVLMRDRIDTQHRLDDRPRRLNLVLPGKQRRVADQGARQ